jgi:TrmH family RNA methyltransferase
MITSTHNPKILLVRNLLNKPAARREAGAFVVEGVRLVEEAQAAGWPVELVLASPELSPRGRQVVDELAHRGAPVEEVSPAVMKSAAGTENPQGVLAVVGSKTLPLPSQPDFLLLLDGMRDPGNLGTILRTAVAAGVQGVLLPPGNADPFAPKVVRSAMGAHFHLPVLRWEWDQIERLLNRERRDLKLFLAEVSGGHDYTQVDFRSPLALIIGGEAEGAGPEARALLPERVHIPMPGKAESLNAAIATGILLFEVLRQRGVE